MHYIALPLAANQVSDLTTDAEKKALTGSR
jgi:hypothetical protein